MNNNEIKRQAVAFSRSRNNLMLVVVFTTINLFLAISGSGFQWLFSARVPMYMLGFGGYMGIVLAFAGVFIYCMCWLLAKRQRAFILVAMILFALDTSVFLLVALFTTYGLHIFPIAFHAWIMYYLITGVVAWAKLRRLTPEQITGALQQAIEEAANFEADRALRDLKQDDDKEE